MSSISAFICPWGRGACIRRRVMCHVPRAGHGDRGAQLQSKAHQTRGSGMRVLRIYGAIGGLVCWCVLAKRVCPIPTL